MSMASCLTVLDDAPAAAGVAAEAWDSHANVLSNQGCMSPQRWPPQGLGTLVACCSSLALSVACVTERGTREHGIVPDGAADAPAGPGVVAEAWDSHANVLSNKGCMSPQRWPPQELVACCSSFALSVACVTERGTREHGIVPDGAADAPAAPGVAADVWDSHDNVLSNKGCMAPPRWPPQALVASCSSLALSVACLTERVSREHGIVSDGAASTPAAVGDVVESPDSHDTVSYTHLRAHET